MGLCAALVLIYASGDAILRLIDRRGIYDSAAERTALRLVFGIGAVSFVQLYALSARFSLTGLTIVVFLGPLLACEGYYLAKELRGASLMGRIRRRLNDDGERIRVFLQTAGLSEKVCVACLIAFCIFITVVCVIMPLYMWDAVSNWSMKAKIIFDQKTIFTEDFFDQYRVIAWRSYPYLLPLAENFFYVMVGCIDEQRMKVLFALFYLAFVLGLYRALTKYCSVPRKHALIAVIVLAGLPSLMLGINGSVVSALADVPLMVFYMLTVVYLHNYMRWREPEHLMTAIICAACSIFTKNEGLVLVVLAAGVFFFDISVSRDYAGRKGYAAWFVFVCFCALLVAPWFIIKKMFPDVDDSLAVLISSWGKHKTYSLWMILRISFRLMFTDLKNWGLLWYFIAASLVLPPGRKKGEIDGKRQVYFFVIPCIYYFFILTPSYMFYPGLHYDSPETKISGMSFERLRFHVLPLLWLFAAVRISRFFTHNGARLMRREE